MPDIRIKTPWGTYVTGDQGVVDRLASEGIIATESRGDHDVEYTPSPLASESAVRYALNKACGAPYTRLMLLLADGRAVLKDQEDHAALIAQQHRARLLKIFDKARGCAKEAFREIEGETLVLPEVMPDDWVPNSSAKHRHWFHVRPFGAGRIHVAVRGECRATGDIGTEDVAGDWTFALETKKPNYEVEYGFRHDGNRDPESMWGRERHCVATLAEALALCERHGADYAAAREWLLGKIVATARGEAPSRERSVADRLADLVREVVGMELDERSGRE